MGSHWSFLGWHCLPYSLLRSSDDFRLESGASPFVVMPDSVVMAIFSLPSMFLDAQGNASIVI